jgi:hypothetical protein
MGLRYHIIVGILHCPEGFLHGQDTLPLHCKTLSAIDEKQKLDPKDSTYDYLKCEVEKKGQR